MKSFLEVFIIADGAGAFVGALLCCFIRTQHHRWPVIARIWALMLSGYAVARFIATWNLLQNGRTLVDCIGLISAAYLRWSLIGSALMAFVIWSSVVMLVVFLLRDRRIKE